LPGQTRKQRALPESLTRNTPTQRGNALLGHWRALDRVTLCPQRIGAIAAAALVLTSLDRGTR